MITDELRQLLEDYINLNYRIIKYPEVICGEKAEEAIKASGDTLPINDAFELEQLMEEVGESFRDKLFLHIDMSGMTDVEVYKRANIDRKLFSKIRTNPACHPRKQTVLALAIALKLSITDTIDLLARAEYAFSPGNKGDLIVKFFIEHEIYDIMAINFALDEYGQAILE